jgi:hypothetical protein
VLAARGARETDAGTAPVGDAALASALRRRAIGVWVRTALWAALTCAMLLFWR